MIRIRSCVITTVVSSLAIVGCADSPAAPTEVSPSPASLSVVPASAITLTPDLNGDVTVTTPGYYVSTATLRTVTIASSGVTLDGLTFVGGGATAAAIRNGVPGLTDITIANSTFSGYTGRSITFGFAEGVANTVRGARITIRNNTIEQGGTNATAVALFNIDGIVLDGNTVTFADGTTGRRGFNIDGDTDVVITNNSMTMGTAADALVTTGPSPWAIQLSMSDAPTSNVRIQGNTILASLYAIVGLSQRDLSDVSIIANDLTAWNPIALNSGSAAPVGTTLRISNVQIHGNSLTSYLAGVRLRDLHAVGASVLPNDRTIEYSDVDVNGNRVIATGPSTAAVLLFDKAVYNNVKFNGNPIR